MPNSKVDQGMGEVDALRDDIAEVVRLRDAALDHARPEAVAKRRKTGHTTARENIDGFLDADSFLEIGRLAKPKLKHMTGPADGLVMGTGTVDGNPVAVMSYDYTVYAGTQSSHNHMKHDRLFQLAIANRWPLVTWLEGGGARPHDSMTNKVGLTTTFVEFARASGWIPLVGICAGRAFAGSANLCGMCDVLIATPKAAIGMAGPPLVRAALGKDYTPEEIGPVEVHMQQGVIDILVENEEEAARVARQYLSYFRGPQAPGEAPDPKKLRDIVPNSPRRAYDVRKVIEGIVDVGSMLELKPKFGRAIVTALAFIEGRPVGIVANQPMFLAGAIDSPASEKAARFIQLCDAFDIPMLLLCDTPGLMVGPDVEKTGLVRRSARILLALANATTPFMTLVLRKAYGLGYYVMGSAPLRPTLLLAWPTAEFGGMGIEGAVNIIYKPELDAAPDKESHDRLHAEKVAELRTHNTALEVAGRFDFDDVIDPADTRWYLAETLKRLPAPPVRERKKHMVDSI
ncbi:MAG: carboxyl transferase domain-containing protein [Pseudomonadota bacterium]|nr:carboxyl transferase domain-containing protein [Pseudomonadota bacterium]